MQIRPKPQKHALKTATRNTAQGAKSTWTCSGLSWRNLKEKVTETSGGVSQSKTDSAPAKETWDR